MNGKPAAGKGPRRASSRPDTAPDDPRGQSAGGTTVPGPLIVTHLWHDGTGWQEEAVATRTFWNGNVRYPAEFTVDAGGKLHILWRTTRVVGQVSTPILEYTTNASGA